jgi:ERCC4-type nuclease
MVAIVADIHERASGVPRALEVLGVTVEVASLAVADYAVADTLVERKTVRGLHAGLVDGTFWRQIGKLRRASRYPFFLVEGRHLDGGPIAPNAIRGACLAVIEQGIRLIRTDDGQDTALWLSRLALRREDRRNRPVYAQKPVPAAADAGEALLAAVPGISTVSARALLGHFGSVAAVLAASPEDWLEVPGIGPDRARALASTLNQRFSS